MPVEVIWDEIDSRAEITSLVDRRHDRTGRVIGVPSSVAPADLLWYVMTAPGMPTYQDAHPTQPNMFVSAIRVNGLTHDGATFTITYESNKAAYTTSYIIEASSTLSTYATNMMPQANPPTTIIGGWEIPSPPPPATRKLFKVGFKPTGTESTNGLEEIPDDLLTVNMLRPVRRITVTQLRNGSLSPDQCAAFGEFTGYVNKGSWMGKKQGSWIICDATAASTRAGYFSTRLQAMSQGSDVWSHFGVMRSSLTGKYALSEAVQEKIDELVAQDYKAYSLSPETADRGCLRIDPYPTYDFAKLFGFGATVNPFGMWREGT